MCIRDSYYLLTMSSNGCNFRILVNDIPVYLSLIHIFGILALGRLDGAAAVDSLLYAIAGKYGPQCFVTEEYFGYRNYGWHVNDRTCLLYTSVL